ncbi:aldehyde dehydrogenase (NADP(+)) [Shewanella sp. 202IG2-18]|uniref:aldehyde dehydrogenase (NADP(+)) n=1 Tax=Parashewanella hymeniacidonis TaxID=2807618 RepID=UPI00195F2A35|nr:aldehyde dehydrogenase (NADP(+)) [Parashewanella hymeniacidonis]MBM7073890.1 aldehyde dehydrogenase (NADP(+)) [Parashewanella hymeniacidonis]
MTSSNNLEISGLHFITQSWQGSADGFFSMNPVKNEKTDWQFAEATFDDVDNATKLATDAFKVYRNKSASEKALFLETIADEIENLSEKIIFAANIETGLPEARLQGETGRTCNQLRLFAAHLRNPIDLRYVDKAQPERSPVPKPESRLSYLPIGPVAVFGASNFPLAFSTAGGDTASALAAGCTVIVKGHPAHPATSELVARAIHKAITKTDMPAGVFSLLQSSKPEVATALVRNYQIKAVGFTGSLNVGRILADTCAARSEPIPFFGELGSVNPQFILPELLSSSAETLSITQVQSMMMGHGQFCTSPGVVIAKSGPSLERYKATLAEELKQQASSSMLTFGIAKAYQRQTQAFIDNDSVMLIGKGQSPAQPHHTQPLAFSVDSKSFVQSESLRQEVFGPCVVIVEYQTDEQALDIADILEGQLTASIHGTESEIISNPELIESISYKVGRIIFNQMPTGVEVCYSMNHGGPYPASTDVKTTSVGVRAMDRFQRPICFQNTPLNVIPADVKDSYQHLIVK